MTGPSDSSVQVEALKPCPFCGSVNVAKVDHGDDGVGSVICNGCGIAAYRADTLPEASPIAAWNRRAALPVAALRDADREMMEQTLERIEQTLTIPAAEYVPAIGDVFLIIDQTRAALRTRLLRHSEGKAG